MNYYNEFDPYAAQWLRNLIAEGLIPDGFVDERSIKDVPADFLKGFAQCHFFAGIGGWPLALRLAGWPDDRPAWTGSCPCQPYSAAGSQKGFEDERDLWPVWFNLIAEVEPAVIFGEQVSAAIGQHWLDRVRVDLERSGYALGAAVLPACAVGAPHKRDRLWFVADAAGGRQSANGRAQEVKRNNSQRHLDVGSASSDVANTDELGASEGRQQRSGQFSGASGDQEDRFRVMADTNCDHGHWRSGPLQVGWNCIEGEASRGGRKHRAQWRTQPGLGLLAHGVPARVGKLRALGNAIVPQVAAEFIAAYAECRP